MLHIYRCTLGSAVALFFFFLYCLGSRIHTVIFSFTFKEPFVLFMIPVVLYWLQGVAVSTVELNARFYLFCFCCHLVVNN